MIESIPPEDARYEVKFVAEATRYRELESWIHMHPAGFRTSYPPRQVNNIYFDTMDLFAFTENLTGASSRSKAGTAKSGVPKNAMRRGAGGRPRPLPALA